MALVAWFPSEADSEMKFQMPDVYLGICFWNKHLLKGGEGSRSGQSGGVMLQGGPVKASAGCMGLWSENGLQIIPCYANLARSS